MFRTTQQMQHLLAAEGRPSDGCRFGGVLEVFMDGAEVSIRVFVNRYSLSMGDS
ncbi:hypothetical protein [Holdemania massiliensis]|uniref:hypothetical protein n=1 Tax=Holdemania massiliensis TaxID=1468449 RepID=UPI001F05EFCA|nr:hypothetical protein [Holdemania massiliensis]MCH1942068.1 hypothetical protein [Holdemania massiliensis]